MSLERREMYLEASSPAVEIAAPVEINSSRLVPRAAPPDAASADAPSRATTELSVLTYNVRGLPWPVASGRGDALRRIGQELATLREEGRQPDVVLIQEGFRREIAELVRASGYAYWARGPRAGLGKLASGGLHVLSDAAIIDVVSVAYRHCAGLDCLANKGVMLVRVAPEGASVPIDIVNTHMNSRTASRAPPAQALAAHRQQTDQLIAFINAHHDAAAPMLVGGDFNVRNAPQRYYYQALARPYTVVSEYCSQAGSGCGAGAADTATEQPWLRSQDLQAFAANTAVQIHPARTETLFTARPGKAALSDHDGYLVRYQLAWTPQATSQTALAFRTDDTVVKPKLHNGLGVKVSWKR